MPFILGILNVSAQSELNDLKEKRQQNLQFPENEKCCFNKNLVAKMIVKAVTKSIWTIILHFIMVPIRQLPLLREVRYA